MQPVHDVGTQAFLIEEIGHQLSSGPLILRFLGDARLPQMDGPTLVHGSKAPAVRAERHAVDPAGLSLEGEQFLAGGAVPDLHHAVDAARRQAPTVRAERHTEDPTGVAFEGRLLGAGGAVPELHRPAPAPRRQALAVRTERHAVDIVVAAEGARLLGRRGVPNLDGGVLAPRQQTPPGRAEGHARDGSGVAWRVANRVPVALSHGLRVPFSHAVAIHLPSGLKTTP